MINYNGQIISENSNQINYNNRGFKYGDALFETIKVEDEAVVFCEDHYFRLMASMRMLRMEIPMELTLEFFEAEILKTINANLGTENRVKFTVFRDADGLYAPNQNKIAYVVEVKKVDIQVKESYQVDLYKDFMINPNLLSTVKTNNKITNVLASIYAKENELDNCVLLNSNKNVVEFTNGNIFLVKGKTITTPPLSDGCVKGVMRKNILDVLEKNTEYVLEESSISPFAIQKADEVFLTNVIVGIQPITQYRKKTFKTETAGKLKDLLTNLS
ncbi:branched-chain amino acid aminotransferase [Wenyingzhuangia heitensis]|uniref:branched-chain-amino-acid transaminase n=1 Tax=Wenyingzhuangia heitensis TaxID=1487859 RepID=A0ABX0UAA2_9FLAO|nr:aminotransferase class IV [Wenyingzhuangia heitensis]NIJ45747.1 branched-chain amino acid aminotransferase [Wenyingzhuangia heitensis]